MRALVVLAAALALVPAARAQSGNADVLAAAGAFDEAQQARDGSTLERMVAPDFLIVHASGKVGSKADFVAGFTKAGVTLDPIRISDRLFVRAAPDVAIVGGEARMSGTEDGKRFAVHFRYADTFTLREGRWLVVFKQVTGLP